MTELKVYNADNEEPNCSKCDYSCGGFDCESSCGPKHGWYGYTRTADEETK